MYFDKSTEEKTEITHIDDGLDLLGWTFRKFKGKMIIKPSKKSIKSFVSSTSELILQKGIAMKQEKLIEALNLKIRGWMNYHQTVCSKKTFSSIDYIIYILLWKWAKRRHIKKIRYWIKQKYWQTIGLNNWRFTANNRVLINLAKTPIIRHPKLKINMNPFLDKEYFDKRRYQRGVKFISGKYKEIWKRQKGLCYHFGQPMDVSEEKRIYLKIPIDIGGQKTVDNMAYIHMECKYFHTECRSKE